MTNVFKSYFFLFFVSVVFLSGILVYACMPRAEGVGEPLSISEVAWMGSTTSADDEWIELYNAGDAPINLFGFSLSAEDGTPRLVISTSTCANTTVSAKGFFLLERTDDDSVLGISADCIYSGSLENGGEFLSIVDAASTTIFTVNASSSWPGGSNATKQTMQWDGFAWVTATGTPRAPLVLGPVISGTIFNDVNKNKLREDGEEGMDTWKVRLYAYPNAPWKIGAEGIPAYEVSTNAAGVFSFDHVSAGRYQVFVEERDGWKTFTKNRYNFLPITLSQGDRAELAITYDATAQMMLGCALKTTVCSKELHQKLLDYRYYGVQVGEQEVVSGLLFANRAL